jgi:glyoxalase family protein
MQSLLPWQQAFLLSIGGKPDIRTIDHSTKWEAFYMKLKGIHHVSALTAKAPDNFDFYTKVLGPRLVKKTVNQDDTSVYHLFYGDEKGNPGTELTFFEIPSAAPNYEGVSSISAISLRVVSDEALKYWKLRFN